MTRLAEHSPHSRAQTDGLRVVTLGRPDAPRQVLVFMGFLAYVEPFELQRFALLCREWDAQITVVDAPGCGYGGARLTRTQRRGLRRGDFTTVARRMVRAAQSHHLPLRRGPVAVVGYSMGASLACAAAADPGLLRVDTLILVEPVAMRRWNLARLIRSVQSEDAVLDEYLHDNNAVPGAVPPAQRRDEPLPKRSRTDLAHLGFALTRGRLTSDMLRANVIQSFPVQVVHGADSRLSQARDVEKLVAICRRAGMQVYDVPVAGRHALWHSLTDVAALAQLTLKQWPR
jgi:alpha-beta hydrolase superfamily lysophospholipase